MERDAETSDSTSRAPRRVVDAGGLVSRAAALVSVALLGCSRLQQVPASAPHGTLHIRTVHPKGPLAFEDTLVFDDDRPVKLKGYRERTLTLRVAPGHHLLTWIVQADAYGFQDVVSHRLDAVCVPAGVAPRMVEDHSTRLQPVASSACDGQLAFDMAAGKATYVVLVAGAENACQACLTQTPQASTCPPVETDRR